MGVVLAYPDGPDAVGLVSACVILYLPPAERPLTSCYSLYALWSLRSLRTSSSRSSCGAYREGQLYICRTARLTYLLHLLGVHVQLVCESTEEGQEYLSATPWGRRAKVSLNRAWSMKTYLVDRLDHCGTRSARASLGDKYLRCTSST